MKSFNYPTQSCLVVQSFIDKLVSMSLDADTIHHTCNVIRRTIQDEVKDLSMVFIVHEGGDIKKTLQEKTYELREFPVGRDVLNTLSRRWGGNQKHAGVSATALWQTSKWYFPVKKNRCLAVFILDAEAFEEIEHVRWHVYHMIFHAMIALENLKALGGTHDLKIVSYDSDVKAAHQNMLADIFAALMSYFNRQRSAIKMLGKWRCTQTFLAAEGLRPELYPYPLAVDAVHIVLEDLQAFGLSHKAGDLSNAMEIVREVEHTFDEHNIRQWQDFVVAAQHMVWRGFDMDKVLQSAMFSSEDPYMRSMAYLVAEFLNIEPRPGMDLKAYNPFTEEEANERLHNRRCNEVFQRLIKDFDIQEKKEFFDRINRRIKIQNDSFFNGDFTGWCVPALHSIAHALEDEQNIQHYEDDIPAYLRQVFDESLSALSWSAIVTAGQEVINRRRTGQDVGEDVLPGMPAQISTPETAEFVASPSPEPLQLVDD